MQGQLNRIKKHKLLVAMMIPGFIFMIIFNYIPMVGILISFQNYSVSAGLLGSEWVGFANFQMFLTDPFFWQVIKNTLVIGVGKLLIGFPAAIILALMLNEIRNLRFKKFAQTISYLPYFLSWVILGGMMLSWFSSTGLINSLLQSFGFITEPIGFLTNPDYYYALAILSDVWKNIGWSTIIYLAAIAGIDPELYEAAKIDGASKLKQVTSITLPSIAGIIAMMLVLNVGGILSSNLDQTMILQNSLNMPVSEVIDSYVMHVGLSNGDYSYATAIGLFRSVITLALVGITAFLVRKISDRSIF